MEKCLTILSISVGLLFRYIEHNFLSALRALNVLAYYMPFLKTVNILQYDFSYIDATQPNQII